MSGSLVEHLFAYVTAKFAVVSPTLGLDSCREGVRGLVCTEREGVSPVEPVETRERA